MDLCYDESANCVLGGVLRFPFQPETGAAWTAESAATYIAARAAEALAAPAEPGADPRPVVAITVGKTRAVVNELIPVAVAIRDAAGALVTALNEDFAAPLMGYGPDPLDVRTVPIRAGQSPEGFAVSFAAPGVYRITEAGINLLLPAPVFRLAEEVVIAVASA